METFFDDHQPLRFLPSNASVSSIACSKEWPPVIAATGYAPCIRAWSPTSKEETQFKPVTQLLEVEGERFVAAAIQDNVLVAADTSSSGRVSIWDTGTWERLQTLTAGAPVSSLATCRTYIAAGTTAGTVRVWRRQSPSDPSYEQCITPDIVLDTRPIYGVWFRPLRAPKTAAAGGAAGGGGGAGAGGGEDTVLVVHAYGSGRVGAWRMSDGKALGTLARPLPPPGSAPDPSALLAASVVLAALATETLLTVSWRQGHDPLLQLVVPLARQGAPLPGVEEHLRGMGRPLCVDYDGDVVALGCEDGTVWVWGLLQPPELGHWRGHHSGAVGAVALVPSYRGGGAVASAGADGSVQLWSRSVGELLAVCRMGWQPCALAVNAVALVVGGAEGQVQILVWMPGDAGDDASEAGRRLMAGCRPSEEDRKMARTPVGARGGGHSAVGYEYWFDARSKAARTGGGGEAGAWGRAAEYPDAFAAFVPPRRELTAEDLMQQQQQGSGGSGQAGAGAGGGAGHGAGGAGTEGSAASASSFNMAAALKGAQRSAADAAAAERAEEAAKRQQLRAMGEGPGVARSRAAVALAGATEALGRKCSNPSCLQREGLLALQQAKGGQVAGQGQGAGSFKRCGACKSVSYCSAHCQATHWRDGHKRECSQLAAAWRRQQEQQQQQQEEEEEQADAAVAAATGAGARSTPLAGMDEVQPHAAPRQEAAAATGGGGGGDPGPGDALRTGEDSVQGQGQVQAEGTCGGTPHSTADGLHGGTVEPVACVQGAHSGGCSSAAESGTPQPGTGAASETRALLRDEMLLELD